MSNYIKNNILLIGAGPMGRDYYKVLKALEYPVTVVGRNPRSAEDFEKLTGESVYKGGIEKFLEENQRTFNFAIVAVGVETLAKVTEYLIDYGIKNILVEKPGGITYAEVSNLNNKASKTKTNVYIGYNRRFYAAVSKAKEIIKKDQGVTSFHFEFTEWSHKLKDLEKAPGVKEKWLLANSTHVIDMAFYLGGKPTELFSLTDGSLGWHEKSIFVGAGKVENGALFSYHSNWEAPGRWGVEVMTKKHRLIFKPLEALQIQEIGSIVSKNVDIEDQLDKDFKPGLYIQTKSFLEGAVEEFCTIKSQEELMKFYFKIGGYVLV